VIFTALVTPLEMSPSSATQFFTEERETNPYTPSKGEKDTLFFSQACLTVIHST
jgi:hypothetical protein